MARLCNIMDSLHQLVERIYSAPIDPNGHTFEEHEVVAMMALAGVGYESADRMAQMAARAYLGWTVSNQEIFRSRYDIPTKVRDYILHEPSWPDQLSFAEEEPGEMDEAMLLDYKKRKNAEIDRYAEEQTVRVMTPGHGKTLTYVWKTNEAKEYLALVGSGGTPVDAEYPFLMAEVGATAATMLEVATVIMMTAHAWVGARAAIEHEIFHSRIEIENAEAGEIPLIVQSAKDNMRSAIDYLIGLMGE